MRDNDKPSERCEGRSSDLPVEPSDANAQAGRLAALAREARLLEFALEGDSSVARRLAVDLEGALESAMDADSADELSQACVAIEAALGAVVAGGMSLSAQLTDMEVDGVLGTSRMPVLTAVLTVAT